MLTTVGCGKSQDASYNLSEFTSSTYTTSARSVIYDELISEEIDKVGKNRFNTLREYVSQLKDNSAISGEYNNNEIDAITLTYIYLEDKYGIKQSDINFVKNTLAYKTSNETVFEYEGYGKITAYLEVDVENRVINYSDNFVSVSCEKVVGDLVKNKLNEIFNDEIPFLISVTCVETTLDCPVYDITTLTNKLSNSSNVLNMSVEVYIDSRNEWYTNTENYSQLMKDKIDGYNLDLSILVHVLDINLDEYNSIDEVDNLISHTLDSKVLY